MTTRTGTLARHYPELCKSWHQFKNGTLTPEDVTPGSGRSVWWICEKGHEWLAVIKNRRNGAGCPYCSGRYAAGDTSLASLNPEIAREWHPTRNTELTPGVVRPGSHRRVWWLCPKGHEWQTVIKNRVSGSGCPYCAGKLATPDNNLADLLPEVARQWHPEKNRGLESRHFRAQSNKKVWWRCDRGHEWLARIQDRAKGTSCPVCTSKSSRLEVRVFCELKSVFQDVVWRARPNGVEVDVYLPGERIGIEIDGSYWHRHREDDDRNKQRQLASRGVTLIRVREKPLQRIGMNDVLFSTTDGEKEIMEKLIGSISRVLPLACGSILQRYLEKREFQRDAEYRKILSHLPAPPSEKSVEVMHPQLETEWNYERNVPLLPRHFSPGSSKSVWWRCKRGHEWRAAISNRTKGIGCPYCSGRLATSARNLEKMRPGLAREWHPTKNGRLQPTDVTPFSHRRVWWLCKKGHEWQARLTNRSRPSARGCPFCSGKRVSPEYNLATLFPHLAREWHRTKNHPIVPETVTPGRRQKAWWKCARGHEWIAAIYSRTAGRGCPYCAGKRATLESNLSSVFPHLARQWHPTKNGALRPTLVRPWSNKKVWWKCRKRHDWNATISNRANGRGCPFCAGKRTTRQEKSFSIFSK